VCGPEVVGRGTPVASSPLSCAGADLFRLIEQCFGDAHGHLFPGDSVFCRDILFAPAALFPSSSAPLAPTVAPTVVPADGASCVFLLSVLVSALFCIFRCRLGL
jgi:hypothetical protein